MKSIWVCILGGSMNELLDFFPLVNGNVLQEFPDHRIILPRHGDVGNSKGDLNYRVEVASIEFHNWHSVILISPVKVVNYFH